MRRLAVLLLLTLAARGAAPEEEAFFRERVEPVLRERCYECHSHTGGKMKGGLTLDSRSGWEAVGSSRVDLQACKLEYSIVSPK